MESDARRYYRQEARKLSDFALLDEINQEYAEGSRGNPDWLEVLEQEARTREELSRQDGRVVRDGAW